MNPISAKIIDRAEHRLLTLATCRKQCEIVPIDVDSDGVETHPDDDLLLGYLDAATDHAERFTGRSLLIRTYQFALDDYPRRTYPWLVEPSQQLQPDIEIPYPPLIAVQWFGVDDSDGALEQDVDYTVDTYGDKAKLRPVSSWPSLTAQSPNAVKCQYVAGYAAEGDEDNSDGAGPLPGAIRAAVLIVVEDLHRNRGTLSQDAQNGAEALLRPWRVLLGMA